ncbi:MAG: carboxylating nicotinate-nucleotide diphosphorylase [Deltaproteobacteria bacterium]|nr:carboxylating nicotinate-nucleotide diphosphorylase [Deltaproteobacteria bacterium]
MSSVDRIIRRALEEDIGTGDITTDGTIDASLFSSAAITAKEEAIVSGIVIAQRTFETVDPMIKFVPLVRDGDTAQEGEVIADLTGRASSLLKAERCALNFLMRLSGIATLTRAFVKAIEGTGAVLLDTRKTTPGLRTLEKYAVKTGGGTNHRFGLFDGVLIKDNHIEAAGGIGNAVKAMRRAAPYHKIEVEVRTIGELREAMLAGADIVMLDNMPAEAMEQAIATAKGKVLIEVSGNVTLENIRGIAQLGPDFISTGAITHSAKAIDISMKLTTIYTKEKL